MDTFLEVVIKGLLAAVGFFVLIFGISLLMAFPTLWLWNWLMPVIFGITKLTFWQAWGMNFLAAILFKSSSSSSSK